MDGHCSLPRVPRLGRLLCALVCLIATIVGGRDARAENGGIEAMRNRVALDSGQVYSRSMALVIGIDSYAHMPQLAGAERDARKVSETFAKMGFETRLLLGAAATRKAILEAIEGIVAERLGARDRLLIYFAGHGVSRKHAGGEMGFLMAIDSDPERPISQGIEMAWLQRVIATEVGARHVMFVADACYSGLAIGHRGAALSPKVPGYVRMIADGRSRVALVAGAAGQQAHEFRGHGLFTYYFLQGIQGAADTQLPHGVVTGQELATFIKGHVAEQSAVHGWAQTPQYHGEGEGEFLFFTGGSGAGVVGTVNMGPAPRSSARAWVWTGGGSLVVGAAAGVLSAMAWDNSERYERYRQSNGSYLLPASYTDEAFAADLGRTRRLNWSAAAAGGVALAGAVTTLVLWLRSDDRSVSVAPASGGASWHVSF